MKVIPIGLFIVIVYSITLINKQNNNFQLTWLRREGMDRVGPIGYHAYDIVLSLKNIFDTLNADEDKIKVWFENNKENIADNNYKGLLKDKNIIFIQWESLESFVVNKEANNTKITPVLNKLLNNSLYFSNIYEQNQKGTSIDGDFMTNTGMFPSKESPYALRYSYKNQNTLQKILGDKGYKTISTHGEPIGNWNWGELHKGFGADEVWDINNYEVDEKIGLGISDSSYLKQVSNKISTVKEKFYLFATTLTSHGPFDLPDKYRMLELPEEINNSYLGGYLESINYTDRQIGEFIDNMKKNGGIKDTVLVIYGDHTGLNKYEKYKIPLKDLDYEDNFWKCDELKVPLLIYNPDLEGETIETYGGLIDVLPTISYLMGINREEFKNTAMGRVLVNTNRNATIDYNGNIVGEVKDSDEEKHLRDMYEIADSVILSNHSDKYKKARK